MSGGLTDEVEHHLQWLRAVRTALLVPHVEYDEHHRHTAERLEHAIGVAERLHARLDTEAVGSRPCP